MRACHYAPSTCSRLVVKCRTEMPQNFARLGSHIVERIEAVGVNVEKYRSGKMFEEGVGNRAVVDQKKAAFGDLQKLFGFVGVTDE